MDDEQPPNHLPSNLSSNDDQLEAETDDRSKSDGRPVIGMEFSSMEETRSYYEAYAGTHREGTTVKNVRTTSTIQKECLAQMRVTVDKGFEKWKVTSFNDIHNHKFITPTKRHMMRSSRNMPNAVKKLAEAFDREHIIVSKLPNIFGGNTVGFDKRDCWNHLSKVRGKNLEIGDAQSVLLYFKKKQVESPHFSYAVQCDEDGTATNFFWVDGRSRLAYRTYGDVTFDTTYRTNKYNMPFAPFSGVNHHNQSILFGCALLQDETKTSFMWLFETWLEAMGGQQPISIITDQDDENAEILRLNHMCQESMKLASIAAPDKDMYLAYMENIQLLTNKLKSMIEDVMKLKSMIEGASSGAASCAYGVASSQTASYDRIDVDVGFNPSERPILDPKVSQTKGRKRESRGKEVASTSGRIKSAIEIATQGRKRLCRFCMKLVNHDRRNCPLNPNSKKRKQLKIDEVADDDEKEDILDTDDDDD